MVRLPELGESVTEGTVTRWLKQVGDQVAADESLLEVSTDKVDTEIPSPAAGTLLEIKVNEDETVDVGAELAVIGSGDAAVRRLRRLGRGRSGAGVGARAGAAACPAPEEQPEPDAGGASPGAAGRAQPRSRPSRSSQPRQPEPEQPEQPAAEAAPAGGRDSSAYVTPLVRKMAAQHGVDLAAIVGTGVGGRIRKQDVLDAAQQQGKDTTPTQPAAAAAAAAAALRHAAPASLRARPCRRPCAARPSRCRGCAR